MDWGEILKDILVAVVIPVAGILGALLARLIKKGIDSVDNENLQKLAWLGVRWAEDQMTGKKEGEKRLEVIKQWIRSKAGKKFDEDTIETAVRAAFQSFQKELGPTVKPATK